MRKLFFLLLVIAAVRAHAQVPTEIYDCLDDANGPDFCSDSTAVLVDDGCGAIFNRYHGRIAWPVLRNVGPVTISVKTRYVRFGTTHLPLYVEVSGRTEQEFGCRLGLGGLLLLVAQGGPECGGAWESVGPINLAPYGVPLGGLYNVQVVFFESLPLPGGPVPVPFHSVGFSCLRVTSHPSATMAATWSKIKTLYH